jgi:hypothetical protein
MPKVSYTVTVSTKTPIPSKDMDDFVRVALKNQLDRYSVGSVMHDAEIAVSTPTYEEPVATVAADDNSGTIDSEDVRGNAPVDTVTDQGSSTETETSDHASVDDDEDAGDAEDNGTEDIEQDAPKKNPFEKK